MLAFAMMAVIRHHANAAAAQKKRNAEPSAKNKTIVGLVIDPMVKPGSSAASPSGSPESGSQPAHIHSRMVTLAQSSPGDAPVCTQAKRQL